MTQELRSPFSKLTREEAERELAFRNSAEERLKEEIPRILEARLKSAEEKRYIILVRSEDENDSTFIDVIGRSLAYSECKYLAMNQSADLENSFIIVEGNTLESSISVLRFLIHMSKVFNDGFNVEDYWGNDSEDKVVNPSVDPSSSQVDIFYDPDQEVEEENV